MHGFSRLDQRISFKMDGERYQNGDDEGFFPHAEDACADDSKAGQNLESQLEAAQGTIGLPEHLNSSNRNTGYRQERDKHAVVAQQFGEHNEDENRKSDATANQAPLVRTKAVRFCLG